VPGGDAEPIAPKSGELFFNTTIEALKVYNGSQWTTNFFHTGDTASRPKDVPVNYLYFDTTLGRLLRRVTGDWTTLDGAIGDLKFVDFATEEAAEAANPGWKVYDLGGRFPVGTGEDYRPQQEGDGTTIDWSVKGLSAHGGDRSASALASLTIGDTTVTTEGRQMNSVTPLGGGSFSMVPKYKAFIVLKKEF
jgi:hypothetical protein